MEYVLIGKIINTHGIQGDLKVDNYSDFVKDRYHKDSLIYLGEDYEPFKVKNIREHQGFLLLRLQDNEDINLVEKHKNKYIYKAKQDIKPLKKGEYYFSDLRDLDVYVDDELIGKVLRVEEAVRNNNLRIKKLDDSEKLIPYLPQFIQKVDLDNKRIDVIKMEGLL